MFKNAAAKIAHNSTINLGIGNQDLRPLQDLITAEKTVLLALQKLSVDFTKSAEALRTWGTGEGEDLADILTASTTLLTSFSTSLSQYTSHEHVIRDGMKSIRTREEALDELKRRRRVVLSKAEGAERKLAKMSPEHKNLGAQSDMLNALRDQIRGMDGDIMAEEAALSDFKRASVRNFMGLKFGGLLEFCEKGTIIGEYGKLIISEVPEQITQPGFPREMYGNHNKVASLLMEAQRCVEDVKLTTVSSSNLDGSFPSRPPPPRITNPDNNYDSTPSSPTGDGGFGSRFGTDVSPLPSGMAPGGARGSDFLSTPTGLGSGHFLDASDISTTNQPQHQHQPPLSSSTTPSFSSPDTPDEFGSAPTSSVSSPPNSLSLASAGGPSGGRFATFPVKNRGGVSLRDDGFVKTSHTGGSSSTPHSALPDTSPLDPHTATRGQFQGIPTPSFTPTAGWGDDNTIGGPPYSNPNPNGGGGLPPGAAPPTIRDSRFSSSSDGGGGEDGGGGLAYMEGDEDHLGVETEEQRMSRHVRFGGGGDVDIDVELDRRHQQGEQGGAKLTPAEEERELNAAAAREITREMDAYALGSSPPPLYSLQGPEPIYPLSLSKSHSHSHSQPPSQSQAPGSFSDPLPDFESGSGGGAGGREGRRPSDASISSQRNVHVHVSVPASPFARRGVVPIDTSSYAHSSQQQQYGSMENPHSAVSTRPSILLPERVPSPAPISTPTHRNQTQTQNQNQNQNQINTQTQQEYAPSPISGRPGGVGIGGPPYAGPFGKSSSSLHNNNNNESGGGAGGAGKISAAAFRRPPPRLGTGASGGGGSATGVGGAGGLPASPYPNSRGASPLPLPAPSGLSGLAKIESLFGSREGSPSQNQNQNQNQTQTQPGQLTSAHLRGAAAQRGEGGERTTSEAYDDTYDYISSYISQSSPEEEYPAERERGGYAGGGSERERGGYPSGERGGGGGEGSPINPKRDWGSIGGMRVVN